MASEADFYIKEGDTSEPLRAQLLDSAGDPKDLTGDDVQFKMAPVGEDTTTVDSSATLDAASDGKVSYQWNSTDTDTSGYYNGVFRVDYGSTGTFDETFPNSQYIVVRVDERL